MLHDEYFGLFIEKCRTKIFEFDDFYCARLKFQ
jgi:hypothetical protein